MPLCTIDEFEKEVLDIGANASDAYEESDAPFSADADDDEDLGVFVFYQGDVDGVCALFILEHHKRLSHGLKLTSYPVHCEADIYSYIKKNLSIITTYPDVQHEAYLRVVLLGVHGWDPELLYAIKVHFSQKLPESRRSELKICIVPASRPLTFFNVSFDADWYFFVGNEEEVALEQSIQERELVGGIYMSTSVASLIASITKTTHESSRAAIMYASAVATISRMEHSCSLDTNVNTQITRLFQEISMLDGGPYVQYDSERTPFPLISFTSLEEALKISPYMFMYDPQRKRDTLAEFRIHCDLMTDEFTSEFCNLDPKRQSQVLRQLNGRIKRVDMTQLLWLRRSCAMPCVDMIYILIAILVGWTNKDNESTVGTAPLIASDFMYNTLTDRMSQESFYDKVIMTQLKQKTYQLVVDTYDAISACKIKSRVFGTHKVLFATLFPKHAVEHIDELRFLGFIISSLHSRGNSDEGFCRVLVFVRNPDTEETLAYGYSPEVSGNFPDIWPLVFSSIAHDDTTFVFDVFRPTCMDIRTDDVESAKNRIADRLRIALEAKQVSYFASNDVHSDEEASFVGSDEETEESQ